jgi:hypothetical protein
VFAVALSLFGSQIIEAEANQRRIAAISFWCHFVKSAWDPAIKNKSDANSSA